MDASSITTQVRSMIAENPVTVTYLGQSVTCGLPGVGHSTEYLRTGQTPSARLRVYSIYADWTSTPTKGKVIVVGGTSYRIQDYKVYFMGVIRFDLTDQYEAKSR